MLADALGSLCFSFSRSFLGCFLSLIGLGGDSLRKNNGTLLRNNELSLRLNGLDAVLSLLALESCPVT